MFVSCSCGSLVVLLKIYSSQLHFCNFRVLVLLKGMVTLKVTFWLRWSMTKRKLFDYIRVRNRLRRMRYCPTNPLMTNLIISLSTCTVIDQFSELYSIVCLLKFEAVFVAKMLCHLSPSVPNFYSK